MRALVLEYSPSSKLKQARVGTRVAKDVVKLKSETLLTGDSKGVKDIMTLNLVERLATGTTDSSNDCVERCSKKDPNSE